VTSIQMNLTSRSNKCKKYNRVNFVSLSEEDEPVIRTHVFFVNSFRNAPAWSSLKTGDVVANLHFLADRKIVDADYEPFVLTKEQFNLLMRNHMTEQKIQNKLDW